MNLDDISKSIHNIAKDKGFWDPMKKLPKKDHFIFYSKQLAMVHSEVTEVLEALRKNKGEDQVIEEMSDIIIRVLDLYAGMIEYGALTPTRSLNESLALKVAHNITRPKMHGVAG